MLRKKSGHIIFQPLDTLFTMIEKGGSLLQKYDAGSGEHIADRTLTPFVLQPHFEVSDGQGIIQQGDHTSELVNCTWQVTAQVNGANVIRGTHYTINDVTRALTLICNLDADTTGVIRFSADYIDPRRKDVIKVEWEEKLSCVSESQWKVTLQTEWPMRIDLMPWKSRGIFSIPVQLYNGESPLPDNRCTYLWQVFSNNAWVNVDVDSMVWCRGGQGTKALSIDQAYVNKLLIRCEAWPTQQPSDLQVTAFLVRRYYGNYDDDIEILEGSYIFPTTTRAVAEAYVEMRNGGRMAHPEQYFNIEILYTRGDGIWWHVAHGSRGEVSRSFFPPDSSMSHCFGELTREITALIPLAINGKILTMAGKICVAHFPSITRDVT